MIWSRLVGDQTASRQGRLGFFAPTAGEEASQMGSNFAMTKTTSSWVHIVTSHN